MRIGNDKSWYENGRLRFEYFRNIVDEGKDFILLETKCKRYAESSYENDDTNDEDRYIEVSYDSHFRYLEKYEYNDEVKYSERNDWYVGNRKDDNKEYFYSNDGVILKEWLYYLNYIEINTYVENIPEGSKDRPKKDDHKKIESRKLYKHNTETLVEYLPKKKLRISMISFYKKPGKIKQEKSFIVSEKVYFELRAKLFFGLQAPSDLPLDIFLKIVGENDDFISEKNYDENGNLISEKKGIDK
tara:strand:- start:14 stop:745 length:732 start_codon:yes stop_codon:yes gene_type:complete